MDIAKIEEKLDKTVAGAMPVSMEFGGVQIRSMSEIFEMAKMLSISKEAVPPHLREQPGICLAVCIQSLEWRFSPFAVANKSYVVNGRLGYEAQLIAAVINARAPLKERLRYRYEGEGGELRCIVSGTIRGEASPLEYESPMLKDIKPQNSPLWRTDPRQQIGYFSVRSWARRYCPETILGIYAEDELRDNQIGAENAVDVTPTASSLKDRLKGQKGRGGFHASNEASLPAPSEKPLETAISEPAEAVGAKLADRVVAVAAGPEASPAALQQAVEAEGEASQIEDGAPTPLEDAERRLETFTLAMRHSPAETDLSEYLTSGRNLIESLPDLTAAERDTLKNGFTTAVYEEGRTRQSKKPARKSK